MKTIRIKEEVCIACHLCEVSCRVAHSSEPDVIKAYRQKKLPMARLRIEEKRPVSFSLRCRQCDEPGCMAACLTGAIHKDPVTGRVVVDEEKCVGCWTCMLVCPLGAIQQDKEHHRQVKCDLCHGLETPACVANCPNEALVLIESETGN